MKINFLNLILLFVLISCKSDNKLDGYYSICLNGEYIEVYFKSNLMRVASDNEKKQLSEWKKIKIKNDTLYFKSFDEWEHDWKVKITYKVDGKTEFHNLNTDMKFYLEPINKKLVLKNEKEFWTEFHNREKVRNCN